MISRGRKVAYEEDVINYHMIGLGSFNAREGHKATIKVCLLGEQRERELRKRFPGASVDIINPNGQPWDDAMHAELHREAIACGISV